MAKSFNAKTTPASGAKWGQKADVRNGNYLIECKTTQKDYYVITTKVWEKIRVEAIKDHGRIPLLVIDLRDKDRYVVFRPQDFEKKVNTYECAIGSLKSYRFKGYSVLHVPILFSLKPGNMSVSHHRLMVMSYLDFKIAFGDINT